MFILHLYLAKENPRIGLLSNGTESSKGTDVIRAAANELVKMESVNYVGYVEGRDVPMGVVDVVVCDGFVGNVLLKTMEGCVKLIGMQIKQEAKRHRIRSLGLVFAKKIFKSVFEEQLDYSSYGGAPLLGLKKLAIVLHGASGARAVKNAIRVADNFSREKMVEKIAYELGGLEDIFDLEGAPFSGESAQDTEIDTSDKTSKRKTRRSKKG